MQSNTGHQNRGNRHQCHALLCAGAVAPKRGTDKGAFVFTKQFFHALEGNGIHIPCITRKVLNLLDGAVIRSMKSVIHAGGQTQSDKAAALPIRPIFFRAEQVLQRVRKAFGLKYFCPLDASVSTNDAINRASHHGLVPIDRACAIFEFSRKAVVHAGKAGLLGFTQIEIGKKLPNPNRCIPHPRLLDFAEPAHKPSQGLPWQAVGEQKVQILVRQ